MDLRTKIARTIYDEDTSTNTTMEFDSFRHHLLAVADAILAIPEIKEALELAAGQARLAHAYRDYDLRNKATPSHS